MLNSFELTILGSNSAVPAFGRHPSSQVLSLEGNKFLIDCGEGCQLQMSTISSEANLTTYSYPTSMEIITSVFWQINTLNLNGREAALNVYGPPDLKGMLKVS